MQAIIKVRVRLMNSVKMLKLCTAAGAAIAMTACATPPYVPTVYDASTANVKTIALADDSMPEKMGANELASAMGTGQAAGGLIGLLVVAAMEGAETSSRVGKLNEMMEPLNFDYETEFETILQTKLSEAGYGDVDVVGGARKKMAPLTVKTLPETTADAVLDVSMVSFGVQKAVTGQEWRPAAGVKVQLLGAAEGNVLMENMISYNSGVLNITETEGFITMEPSAESVGYLKIKEMDPEVVRDETRVMLNDIADMIITLL